MSDRIRFIPNPASSDQVLLIDLRGFNTPSESLDYIALARSVVAAQPHNSLQCLVDVTDARFNTEVVEAMKEFAAHNRPFVISSAIVGVTGLQRIILEAVTKFTGRTNLKAIPTRDEAFTWLAEQRAAHVPSAASRATS